MSTPAAVPGADALARARSILKAPAGVVTVEELAQALEGWAGERVRAETKRHGDVVKTLRLIGGQASFCPECGYRIEECDAWETDADGEPVRCAGKLARGALSRLYATPSTPPGPAIPPGKGPDVRCQDCGWMGPGADLVQRLHCRTCPQCNVVFDHGGASARQLVVPVAASPAADGGGEADVHELDTCGPRCWFCHPEVQR